MRKLVWGAMVAGAVLTGCQKNARPTHPEVTNRNLVTADNPEVARAIGDSGSQYEVLGNQAVHKKLLTGELISAHSPEGARRIQEYLEQAGAPPQQWGGEIIKELELPAPQIKGLLAPTFEQTPAPPVGSLKIGIPGEVLNKRALFGGVITSVSDSESIKRGLLKLTEFPATDVELVPIKFQDGRMAIGLLGCVANCDDPIKADKKPVVALPVDALDEKNNKIIVELAPLGDGMDFSEMVDSDGTFTESVPNFSRAVSADFSQNTLVFDVESTRTPISRMLGSNEKDLKINTRWYLRLMDGLLNPNFKPRDSRTEVGFFTSKRATSERVTRFDLDNPNSPATVKYYVKNVPQEYQAAFAAAFEEWNQVFQEMLGRKVLVYEFVGPTDPRSSLLVTGDVRYNILEWDTKNHAPYGGLGPNSASQTTGQIQSANILIQGPDVDRMYKRWFGINGKASEAIEKLGTNEVSDLQAELIREVKARAREEAALPRLSIRLGKNFSFVVNSQRPELQDPAMKRMDFIETPAGYSFEAYMFGYFKEMVAHELGHNLGLRHNFRGNLGAREEKDQKIVSRSVMEYLGRGHRHLNRIGEYDRMAIAYGYKGIAPTHADWFCTDENVGNSKTPALSAECSKDDATSDPYTDFEKMLSRALRLIVAPTASSEVPSFATSELSDEFASSVTGLVRYAASAEATSAKWTNFSAAGRPSNGTEIRDFVLKRLVGQVCDAELQKLANQKTDQAAKDKATKNLASVKTGVEKTLKGYKLLDPAASLCE